MDSNPIIGRFAPTPSGPLHFGSLVTAVASYCHARSQQGKWLLRMEDVDTPRNVKGASDDILFTLEAFGFQWDAVVEYQSHQFDHYQRVLESLIERCICYACECSRRTLREANALQGPLGLIYPGFCRDKRLNKNGLSIRVNTGDCCINFVDQVYGHIQFNLSRQLGDFVVKRADGIYAYHLAVVVDDERQGINQIVRGADLLEASCLHLYLQQLLGYRQPQYLHIPIVKNALGDKLSKQTGAEALDHSCKNVLLTKALAVLGQQVDTEMEGASSTEILNVAIQNWEPDNISLPALKKT